MSSVETLSRVVKKNRAAKVKQLSDIAALFEKETRLKTQLVQLHQFEEVILDQKQTSKECTNELPKQFLNQQAAHCEMLLETISKCKEVVTSESNQIDSEQLELREGLKKIDLRIDKAETRSRQEKSFQQASREILESEEHALTKAYAKRAGL